MGRTGMKSVHDDDDDRRPSDAGTEIRVYEYRAGEWIDARGGVRPLGWWGRVKQWLVIGVALALLAVLFVFALALAIVIAPLVIALVAWALWRIRRHVRQVRPRG
jgi:hypothetical protein